MGRKGKNTVLEKGGSAVPPMGFTEAEAHILEAFIDLCYSNGAHNVSFQMIADASGMAHTSIHYYFAPKKRDLKQAALLYMFQESYRFIESEMLRHQSRSEAYNPIESYAHVMFDWLEMRPAFASYLIHYYYFLSCKPEIVISNQEFLNRAYLRIESYLHEAIGRGLFKKPAKLKDTVTQIHSAITGCCLIATIGRKKEVRIQQREACLDMIRGILQS